MYLSLFRNKVQNHQGNFAGGFMRVIIGHINLVYKYVLVLLLAGLMD